MKLKAFLCTLLMPLLLVACGGGDGSQGVVASTNSFDVRSGYTRLISTGFVKTFTLSGTCSGSTTITTSAANTATTFNGGPALSGTTVGSTTYTNCTPASSSGTVVRYYDSNYAPLGRSSADEYAVFLTTPTLPTNAKVGDAGVVGSLTVYSDSSKSTITGREDTSYVMEADTASTAILNVITKSYDRLNNLESTEQDRYRVASDGSLTFVSFDIQYATGSKARIIGN